MIETIYGAFETINQANAAAAELSESGIGETSIILNFERRRLTVLAKPDKAVEVRTIIERHNGRTEVDDIPDAGSIPQDPLEYSDDTSSGALADN